MVKFTFICTAILDAPYLKTFYCPNGSTHAQSSIFGESTQSFCACAVYIKNTQTIIVPLAISNQICIKIKMNKHSQDEQ